MGMPEVLREGLIERRERQSRVVQEMVVRDLDHARSDEVLNFCVEKLRAGATYNELRLMLGLRPASIDRLWREIRECLV